MDEELKEWLISPAELLPALGKVVLVDVREDEEWAEGRIAGAKHIPLGELQARASGELDPSSDIVIYCAHGMRSLQGLLALRMLGFEKLKSLDGGICAWEEAKGPVVR